MERRNKIQIGKGLSKILLTLILLFEGLTKVSAYNRTFNLNVGDEFTVYTTYHNYNTLLILT